VAKRSRPGIMARAPIIWPSLAVYLGVLGGFIAGAVIIMFN
jgi:hypothetical protein